MKEETVREVRDLMSSIERHYQEQISVLETALAVNKRDNGYSGVNAQLEAKHKLQDDVRDAAMFKLKGRLKEAETREAAVAREASELLAKQSETAKARALVAWREAGGSELEFSQAWPSMKTQMIQVQALKNLAQKLVLPSNVRL